MAYTKPKVSTAISNAVATRHAGRTATKKMTTTKKGRKAPVVGGGMGKVDLAKC